MATDQNPYAGRTIILTSKHQKLDLFQESFHQKLAAEVRELPLDTDLLGTFSGEIERVDSPLESAIKKARMGMQATGIPLGIASEGSIGADPTVPWIQADYELAVFVDSERDLVISQSYLSHEICAAKVTVGSGADLAEFLLKAGFPDHGLIVRPDSAIEPFVIKGVRDYSSLELAIEQSLALTLNGLITIESDFRAMHSPTRRANIFKAAELLAARISNLCPQCNCPGWGRIGYLKGVSCSDCGLDNPEAIFKEELGCYKCDLVEQGRVIRELLDPASCIFCNP